MPQPRSKNRARDSQEAVDAAKKRIREAWNLGKQLKPFDGADSRKWQDEAAKRGINVNVLRQIRQFVRPDTGFSEEDVTAICDLCDKYQRAIGRNLVFKFTHIDDQSERLKFVKRAISGRWNYTRARHELIKAYGRSRDSGKRPKIPADMVDRLVQVEAMSHSWLRWYRLLQGEQDDKGATGHATLSQRFPGVGLVLTAVERQMVRLQAIAEVHLELLRAPKKKKRGDRARKAAAN